MTTLTEQAETAPNSTAAEPKAKKESRADARVATKKARSGKKATPAKKAP